MTIPSSLLPLLSFRVVMSDFEQPAVFEETLAGGDKILLTELSLDEKEAIQHVRKAEAGATVLFVGTTRNEFRGG